MNNNKELEKLKAQKQEKLQLITQEKESLISQLKSQIDYLKSDLMAYKDDEQEEQNYLNEIETLEALGGETVDKHMQEIRKLRRNQAKIAYKLDSVASAKLEDIQKSAFKMAQKQVAYEEQEKRS
ncbi:hypothetical protein PPERSA_02502 [Pseudocohnilembus persalinus]|uniref:Uncharacterized protein n=1 Tax=Pseudocohnilembus persalinus TaxID=266149 RepID=A0A0V0QAY9_PSEPJ|nr:hypothetical protein PPERSA_02502 [Pseudocohnilembus persalinus]|eukprot:KRW99390.1 hypothetical protein PPERSA_02502 [Pseudocohnilembus persalinus]